ncbi:MAG: ABC transporter ATP-binding protein [Anaerolineae bacterium]|jgi:energy-coupling factor transport system ATP-binding protein
MSCSLQANDVSYGYPQHGYGLRPISLDVGPGDAVHIAGPSGSGKSTLARCLSGLIPHLYRGQLTGEVQVDGLATCSTPLWQLAERTGLVFQNPAVQLLTVRTEEEIVFGLENLGLPPAAIKQGVEDALRTFGLEALRHRSPQRLSGGEQQKLVLSAITARQPHVLILDEPLSMLDSTAATQLVADLAGLAQSGTTVVVCEHRAEFLQAIPNLRTVYLNGSASAPLEPSLATETGAFDVPPFELLASGVSVALGGHPVLQDISLTAEGGQVVAIVGRNGVGKTTLLRALAGLQGHTGEIQIDGQPPELAMVFQNPDLQLFNASVRDEVLYRLEKPDIDRYEWLMEILGLSRYEETPPLLLSEGEKKRLAVATTLMRAPRHGILLDEPSLGQDAGHKETLMRLAHALADAGQLVMITTHDLTLAASADRLLIMGESGFVADGPPHDVLRDKRAWDQVGLLIPDWMATN